MDRSQRYGDTVLRDFEVDVLGILICGKFAVWVFLFLDYVFIYEPKYFNRF